MKLLYAAVAGAALFAAAPALAQETGGGTPFLNDVGFYGTIGYTQVQVDNVDLSAVGVRAGVRLNNYLGIEGEYHTGTDEDELDPAFPEIEVGLDNQYAIYAVGYLRADEAFDLFARVGIGSASAEVSGLEDGEEIDEDGDVSTINYGVGAQWFPLLNRRLGIRAEYTRLDNQDDEDDALPAERPGGSDIDMYSLSAVFRF